MAWVGLALLAHAGNAAVFIVDKSLLGSRAAISQPIRYTFWSGVLAAAAAVVLPFAFVLPTGFVVGWSAVAGLLHLAALWCFFVSLKGGEPSRVVPIAGSAVPAFTFLFAAAVLGEELAARSLLAVLVLVAGGVLLSVRLERRGLSSRVLVMTLISGALFAAYFSTVKFLYDNAAPFLPVFAYSRIVEASLAVVLLGPVVWLGPQKAVRRGRRAPVRARTVATVFVGNKVLAAGAFLLQNYAISLGSVTVVNSLQGVQYLFLLGLAVLVSRRWPRLFQEELHRVSLLQKLAGIGLVSAGLALLVM